MKPHHSKTGKGCRAARRSNTPGSVKPELQHSTGSTKIIKIVWVEKKAKKVPIRKIQTRKNRHGLYYHAARYSCKWLGIAVHHREEIVTLWQFLILLFELHLRAYIS
jgi:hypothetical protein